MVDSTGFYGQVSRKTARSDSSFKNVCSRHVQGALGVLVLFTVVLLNSALCAPVQANNTVVVTTIFPLQEFAGAVGGERAQVTVLLPPGAEAHTWEPKPSDIVTLSRADVFIYVSSEMEPWVPSILRSITGHTLQVYEVRRWLPKPAEQDQHAHHHESSHHGGDEKGRGHAEDPHVWLDFSYDQVVIDNIVRVFTEQDPEQADYYAANGQLYKEKLGALDAQFRETLATCEHGDIILGGHAAFGFLAERYGLRQIPLYGFNPNAEPTPRTMAGIIDYAGKHQVKAIFFEELVSDRLAKAIAREINAKTLVLNPGANLSRKQIEAGVTFIGLMEQNLESLKDGLSCQ